MAISPDILELSSETVLCTHDISSDGPHCPAESGCWRTPGDSQATHHPRGQSRPSGRAGDTDILNTSANEFVIKQL